jgi:hypothetical protein
LRALKGVLRQMVAGSVVTVGDGFGAMAGGMASKAKLTGKELKQKMPNAVVWMDFVSVPQPSAEKKEKSRQRVAADTLRAIHSIPFYIACSTLMLVLCPPVMHRELQIPLGLGSWLERAWCRLEVCVLHACE